MQEETYSRIMHDLQKRLELGLAGHAALLSRSNLDIIFALKRLGKRDQRNLAIRAFRWYQYWFSEARYDRRVIDEAKKVGLAASQLREIEESYAIDLDMILLCLNVYDALKEIGAIVPQLRTASEAQEEEDLTKMLSFSPEAALAMIRSAKAEENKLEERGEGEPSALIDRKTPLGLSKALEEKKKEMVLDNDDNDDDNDDEDQDEEEDE